MAIGNATIWAACALLAACAATPPPVADANPACAYDRARLMALDELQFDQDLANGGGGWRAIAAKPGCEAAAADLVRDYREAHGSRSDILFWHEAQMRAFAGDDARAIALMARARKPAGTEPGGWNPYVDATIAFLRKDRPALDEARNRLAALPPPADPGAPPVKDGIIELPMADGQRMRMRWPPNLDVVDGLRRCFGQPYGVAYGDGCRPPAP